MQSLRRHRIWLSLILVLTMVCTIGGMPVSALACQPGTLGSSGHAAVGSGACPVSMTHCPTSGKRDCHCCGAPAATAHASRTESRHFHAATPCVCSLDPSGPPPATAVQAVPLVVWPDMIAAIPAVLSISLPTRTPWRFASPSTGPPQDPFRPDSPSRAPPVS